MSNRLLQVVSDVFWMCVISGLLHESGVPDRDHVKAEESLLLFANYSLTP